MIKNNDLKNIDQISSHTIMKMQLISDYAQEWGFKLASQDWCDGIVYIDCMSNAGMYISPDDKEIKGTSLLVAEKLKNVWGKYKNKNVCLMFNDNNKDKIELLKEAIPSDVGNFSVQCYNYDRDVFLKDVCIPYFNEHLNYKYLLVYDPYKANIDWDTVMPFLKSSSEVIINHMVSDTVRAARVAKKPETIKKYETTYQTSIDKLIGEPCDSEYYENIIRDLLLQNCKDNSGLNLFIASFPFFNSNNSLLYNLFFCSYNRKGFIAFKKTAWKTFGDRSSCKSINDNKNQFMIIIDNENNVETGLYTDIQCYSLYNVAEFIYKEFYEKSYVSIKKVWKHVDNHPVFVADGYKTKIRKILKEHHGVKFTRKDMIFQ